MRERYTKTLLLNMCMVYDPATERVVALDKLPKTLNGWGGVTFPGGHVEPGESIHASVIREVKEETGLDISDIEPCGMIDWFCRDDNSRWIVFLYKTAIYKGSLLEGTHEGKVFWLKKEEILKQKLAPDFETYLKIFFGEENEAFGTYSSEEEGKLYICDTK